MTDDQWTQVNALLAYLRNATNDNESHTDILWLEMQCMNNSELSEKDILKLKTIQERTIGYGTER